MQSPLGARRTTGRKQKPRALGLLAGWLAVFAMANFSHIAPPEAVATELQPFTPGDGNFSLHLLPAGLALPEAEKAHLRGWKHLCDELLPALRSRG